jgi:FKBP-type peptidyl-prolyl cis-trans isomerase FklB
MMLRCLTAAVLCAFAFQASAHEPTKLKPGKEQTSYSIGADLGRNLQRLGVDIDPALILEGIKDALSGDHLHMSDEEINGALQALQADIQRKQQAAANQAGEENKKVGEAFLAENKSKEGVVTLPSGLQYKILKAGDGPKPTANDKVECHYKGTLINGREFDSSYKRGSPATFGVGQVIPGWQEALQLMPVGSKWQLFVPAGLAYGERGAGREIAPNSTLIFEVELLAIKKD